MSEKLTMNIVDDKEMSSKGSVNAPVAPTQLAVVTFTYNEESLIITMVNIAISKSERVCNRDADSR